jgi:flavin reductase (DIM6/NTAB) family NADH-FMN oxidoreductase RutF/rubredoxin
MNKLLYDMNIEAYFKVTYGLYVVSSEMKGKFNGYISNTVFQVTAEPARFAIACSKNNFTAEMIRKSGVFSISVLKKETRPDIIGTFGYRSGKDTDKFTDFNFKTGITGVPILLDDTIAWFECKVDQKVDTGTHLLFIGKVLDCELPEAEGEPLTYDYYREVKKGKAPKNAPTYIDPEKQQKEAMVSIADRYYCPACGYIYDPAKGDPEHGIPAGTRFEDLPAGWVCPVCGTEKEDFVKK